MENVASMNVVAATNEMQAAYVFYAVQSVIVQTFPGRVLVLLAKSEEAEHITCKELSGPTGKLAEHITVRY